MVLEENEIVKFDDSASLIKPSESKRVKSRYRSSTPENERAFAKSGITGIKPWCGVPQTIEQKRVNRSASSLLIMRTNASVRKEKEPGFVTSPARRRAQKDCIVSLLTSWQWLKNCVTQSSSTGFSETDSGKSLAAFAVIASMFSCRLVSRL